MRKTKLGKWLIVGLLSLGMSVFATGCGSSQPKQTSGAAPSMPTVVIAKAVDTIPFTMVDIASAEGFFAKNGVNVKETLLQGSSQANAALVGGSVQFAFEAANPLLLARSHGVPVVAVDAIDNAVPLQLVVSKKWIQAHPVSPSASVNEKIRSLKGMTYGEVSTTDLSFLHLLGKDAGLPPSAYSVEQLGSQAEIAMGLEKGTITAFLATPPSSYQVIAQGYAEDFVDGRTYSGWANCAYDILVTDSNYVSAHPDVVQKVATAIAEADNFAIGHPDQVLTIEEKHFPSMSSSVLKDSIGAITFSKDGLQSQDRWNHAVQLAKDTGMIKGNVVATEGVEWTNKYIDASKLSQ